MQSVLKHCCQSHYSGRGLRPCDVTQRSARFEKGVKILVVKNNTGWIFIIIRWLCTHSQHSFQFKQLVKVHVALYDLFKNVLKMHFSGLYKCQGNIPFCRFPNVTFEHSEKSSNI